MGQDSSSTVGVGQIVQVDPELLTDLRLAVGTQHTNGIQGLNSGKVELTCPSSSDS